MTGRPPTSPHGRLFGGDTLFEVLLALARDRSETYAVPLASQLGRTVKQTRDELAKLQSLGVVVETGRVGKARLLKPGDTDLANSTLALPELLINELGQYAR